MADLRELYQEVILDHGRKPRKFHALADADRRADGYNPLCGDKLTVFLKLDDGRISEVSFQGSGCAISVASASLMAQALEGLTVEEAERRFEGFKDLVTGKLDDAAATAALGKLAVFAGVREFPVRVKCATLCWHTMRAALSNEHEPVTTE